MTLHFAFPCANALLVGLTQLPAERLFSYWLKVSHSSSASAVSVRSQIRVVCELATVPNIGAVTNSHEPDSKGTQYSIFGIFWGSSLVSDLTETKPLRGLH